MSPAPIIPRRKSRKSMRKGKPAPIRQEAIPSIPNAAVRQTNPAESPKKISAFGIFPVLRSKKSAAPERRRSSAHFTVRYVNCITSEEYRKPSARTYAHSRNFRRESAAEQGDPLEGQSFRLSVPGSPAVCIRNLSHTHDGSKIGNAQAFLPCRAECAEYSS